MGRINNNLGRVRDAYIHVRDGTLGGRAAYCDVCVGVAPVGGMVMVEAWCIDRRVKLNICGECGVRIAQVAGRREA